MRQSYDTWKMAQDDRWLCEKHEHWTTRDICPECEDEAKEQELRGVTAKHLRDARKRIRLAKLYRRDLQGLVTFERPQYLLFAAFATEAHKKSEIGWLAKVEAMSEYYPAWAAMHISKETK